MSNFILVLDTNRKPLNPCTPGIARGLLKSGKARVFRRFPFVIILNKAVLSSPAQMQLKLDPGSKTTGIALLQGEQVVFGAELTHRGQQIKNALESRRALRRGRRSRKTRYRKPRFLITMPIKNRRRLKPLSRFPLRNKLTDLPASASEVFCD